MNALDIANYMFAIGGFIFSIVLIPTLLDHKAQVPRSSSIPTAIVLTAFTIAYFALGTWLALISDVLLASLWFAVAIWRPVRPIPPPEEVESRHRERVLYA